MKRMMGLFASALLSLTGMRVTAAEPALPKGEFTVLQWNIWQEGTVIPGGYDAIVNEIARLRPDFVTFSEVRNYQNTRFNERITASLKAKGLEYHSFYSRDSGLLSRHPIVASSTVFPEKGDHGSVYRLLSVVDGRKVAVYTAHLDYRDCASYNVRGYDGSTWQEIPIPKTAEEVLKRNTASQRDEAIRAFLSAVKKDLSDGYAVILGGDFNEPSHRDWTAATANLFDHQGMVIPWTCTALLEKNGFIDAYRKIYPNPVTHPGFTFPSDNPEVPVKKLAWAPKADERDRIDFIFYRGAGLDALDISVFGPKESIARGKRVPETGNDPFILPLGVWPTDHKGLFARFRFRDAAPSPAGGVSPLRPADLRCEMLENPLGVAAARPRLSWGFAPGDPVPADLAQTAYRISVRRAGGPSPVWDSGWVESAENAGIPYGGKPLAPDSVYCWTVSVRDNRGAESEPSAAARWTTGLPESSEESARWIGNGGNYLQKEESRPFDPWFRKTFTLPAAPEQAFLHIASVGYHEVYVNGNKADDTVLCPCVTDNGRRARSVTYDVARLLGKGRNVIGVWLGAGWSVFPEFQTAGRPAGPIFRLRCDAHLPGGGTVTIASGPDWKTAPSNNKLLGDWRFQNFGGEFQDGGIDADAWRLPGFDDSAWKGAAVCDPPLTVSPQPVEPNRVATTFPARKVTARGGGCWQIDMGRNFAGWVEIPLEGKPGDVVEIDFSERPERPRTFNLHSRYKIGPSGRGVFRNRFNYGTGRWIQIRGVAKAPAAGEVKGLQIRTDYRRAAAFRCSDDLMNWIHDTALWTFENLTLGGYPVDCPSRERMGYGGDAHATSEAGMFHYRLDAFYAKWLEDWRDTQGRPLPWLKAKGATRPGFEEAARRGALPNTAPTYWGAGGPAYGGIVVTLPWWYYLQYGDRKILADNFGTIDRWIGFLDAYTEHGLLLKYGGIWDFLGDWLWPDEPSRPNSHTPDTLCLNNIYRIYNLRTAAKIARALGRDGKAAAWEQAAEAGAKAVHAKYFHPEDGAYFDGRMSIQGAALLAGIPPAGLRAAAEARLEKEILVNRKGHVGCGITGGALLFHWLRAQRRDDLIYAMASQTDYPGWGYMRKKGATTIWEAWNADRTGTRHSLLHSSYLYIAPWFIDSVLGIRNAPGSVGFRRIEIRPPKRGATDLRWAKGSYDTPNGPVEVDWSRADSGKGFRMRVVVPVNATAEICVPSEGRAGVSADGRCRWLRDEPGYSVYSAGSGPHQFH